MRTDTSGNVFWINSAETVYDRVTSIEDRATALVARLGAE